ncbi:hypothetical protein BaRGS_00008847 [Batillaria attramentaria]|uniref:Uncharacterized protein n=1 Tax=Batillaria attramentaria TaxID=370345 RepID=A0ABD0LKE5_9CAEN
MGTSGTQRYPSSQNSQFHFHHSHTPVNNNANNKSDRRQQESLSTSPFFMPSSRMKACCGLVRLSSPSNQEASYESHEEVLGKMASQQHQPPHHRPIQQDWANREYVEVITCSIKKISDFLNSFDNQRRDTSMRSTKVQVKKANRSDGP